MISRRWLVVLLAALGAGLGAPSGAWADAGEPPGDTTPSEDDEAESEDPAPETAGPEAPASEPASEPDDDYPDDGRVDGADDDRDDDDAADVDPAEDESAGASEDTAEPGAPAEPAPLEACAEARWRLSREGLGARAQALALLHADCPPAAVRDTHHLLGRLYLAAREPEAAALALRVALEAHAAAPSPIADVLRLDLAEALAASGEPALLEEALGLLPAVVADPHSALRAEAAHLHAELEERLGRHDDARKSFEALLDRWPTAPFSQEVRLRLGLDDTAETLLRDLPWSSDLHASIMRTRHLPSPLADIRLAGLGLSGASPAADDPPQRVPLEVVDALIRARRHDEARALLQPWLELVESDDADARRQGLDALERDAELAWEQHRYGDFLAARAKLKAKGRRVRAARMKEARAMALDGDFDAAWRVVKKAGLKSDRADFLFEFGKCDEAVSMLHGDKPKAQRKRRRGKNEASEDLPSFKAPADERVALCLVQLGRGLEAAPFWEKEGKGRGRGDALHDRYWYARALAAGGQEKRAARLYERIVADDPVSYYGHQAHSRLAELRGEAPESAAPFGPNIRWRSRDPASFRPTLAWTEASLAGAFDEAPTPLPPEALEALSGAAAERWGGVAKEIARAHTFIRLGELDAAREELRVVEADLRVARRGAKALAKRARSDLLDNRRNPAARGGAPLDEGGRRTVDEATSFAGAGKSVRRDVRALQVALADPWALRKSVFESGRVKRLEKLDPDDARKVYPIAYADVVGPVSEQFGLPPYYVYAIMATESAFHPGAVSVANAWGLVQVIPPTGRHLARELGFFDFSPERLLDPGTSVYFGAYYLARLLNRFRGQELLAAAGYNAGPHRVTTWLRARGHLPMDIFIEWIPYTQARKYAKRIVEHVGSYRRVYHDEPHVYVKNTVVTELGDGPNY